MTPEGIAVGLFIAAVLIAVAVYYAGRQQATLEQLRFNSALAKDERRYLLQRSWRRLFGSLLLIVLAMMLVGALFLDYDPPPEDADRAVFKQSIVYVFAYVLAMLLVVMAMLVVAIFDFWATARFGVEQRKQLVQEHQERLTAELAEFRNRHDFREGPPRDRRADLN